MSGSSAIGRLENRAIAGDQRALANLFEHYRERLGRMIRLRMDRRLQGRVSESDVLQEAFLEMSRRLQSAEFSLDVPFFLWVRWITAQRLLQVHRYHLGTAMRNACRDIKLCDKEFPEAGSHSMADQLLGSLTSPSQAAVRAELQLQLQEILNGMEPIDREILAMRHFEDLTNGEVAMVLGISKAAASKRYIQALRRLRTILLKIPGFSENGS